VAGVGLDLRIYDLRLSIEKSGAWPDLRLLIEKKAARGTIES
jgi:hypothetical protein